MQESNPNIISMGIEEWANYACNGIDIPLTTLLHGSSMEPLIRYMKDEITFIPMKRDPLVGDIVLFRRLDGKYVVHRIYKVNNSCVQTWGDNCYNPDAPLCHKDVLGLVVQVKRGGQVIPLDTAFQRSYGNWWMRKGRPMWFRYLRLRSVTGKLIRKVYPNFRKERCQINAGNIKEI